MRLDRHQRGQRIAGDPGGQRQGVIQQPLLGHDAQDPAMDLRRDGLWFLHEVLPGEGAIKSIAAGAGAACASGIFDA